MYESVKDKIKRVAAQNPAGFTYRIMQNTLATKGYVVACFETQNCFGNAGLYKVIKHCMRNLNCCVGGWRNEDGTMQYDASVIYKDLQEAINAAVYNQQRAIFNLYTGRVIMANEYELYLQKICA